MSDESHVELGEAEQDEFLGTGGTGVLSLSSAGDDPPHSVPVSYGFDPKERTFYFRLAVGSDSAKGDLRDRPATFVTYRGEEDDAGPWESVVARGRLEDIEEDGVGTEALAGLDRVNIPIFDVFEQPLRLVDFEFVRLEPEALTGRKESLVNE